MNLLNVAIVTTHGTFKSFRTNLAYRVFSTRTTRQAYRNRYNIIDHGHKNKLFLCISQRPIKSMEDFGETILIFFLDWEIKNRDFQICKQKIPRPSKKRN